MNPRTPVVVGVGQVLNRSKDLDDAIEPIQMMLKALYRAEEDSGAILDRLGLSGDSRSLGLRQPCRFHCRKNRQPQCRNHGHSVWR